MQALKKSVPRAAASYARIKKSSEICVLLEKNRIEDPSVQAVGKKAMKTMSLGSKEPKVTQGNLMESYGIFI